jgi:hypothetical protein
MSMYISEMLEWLRNLDTSINLGGGVSVEGNSSYSRDGSYAALSVTGSISALPALAIGSGTFGRPVLVFSGSGTTGLEGFSGSIGIQLPIGYTSSLAMGRPTAVQLTSMFPNFQTGSLVMVGSGSETWLVFKDIKGVWRTMTASLAA